MNRRLFLSSLAAAPLEPQVRRVYSFIWGNPLARQVVEYRTAGSELWRPTNMPLIVDDWEFAKTVIASYPDWFRFAP